MVNQMDLLVSRERMVKPAARGYPPSGVPTDPAAYSQRAGGFLAAVARGAWQPRDPRSLSSSIMTSSS